MILILLVLIFLVLLLGAPFFVVLFGGLFGVVWFTIVDFLAWLGWGGGTLLVLALIAAAWADMRFGLSGPKADSPREQQRLAKQREENLKRWRKDIYR